MLQCTQKELLRSVRASPAASPSQQGSLEVDARTKALATD